MKRDTDIPYRGLYINLERSAARRNRMEAQLSALGLGDSYARLPATDGSQLPAIPGTLNPGEAGAFHSHIRALEAAGASGLAVHILEDDAVLSALMGPLIGEAVSSSLFQGLDILFTDVLFSPHLGMLKTLKAVFDALEPAFQRPLRLADFHVIDLAWENFSCLTSYVVGAGSVGKLLGLYRAELASPSPRPVDIFLRDCIRAGRLRAALLFPFVTSFQLDEIAPSTIAAGADSAKPSVLVLAMLRYMFFVDRDLAAARVCLDRATRQGRRPVNAHHELMAQAVEFILSPDFQEF